MSNEIHPPPPSFPPLHLVFPGRGSVLFRKCDRRQLQNWCESSLSLLSLSLSLSTYWIDMPFQHSIIQKMYKLNCGCDSCIKVTYKLLDKVIRHEWNCGCTYCKVNMQIKLLTSLSDTFKNFGPVHLQVCWIQCEEFVLISGRRFGNDCVWVWSD